MSDGGARTLRLGGAVWIGLAAMIGAGVFAAFAPAAAAAGSAPALLGALLVAGTVAFCNASSTAQLAARYPAAGGAYVYGRERLGEWWGFGAGWSFVVGKTASCAAMALTFAAYAVPDAGAAPQKAVAALAVVALVGVNLLGITRTAAVARVLVVLVLGVLAVVVAAGAVAAGGRGGVGDGPGASALGGPYGVLQAAGLLFFAFAGYARIATLGGEVREPARTIPRAIGIAFAVAFGVYLAVALAALAALGPERLAGSADPLSAVVTAAGWGWAAPVVGVGAALSSLGALLALVAGVGRTASAMGQEGDLPRMLGPVHPRHSVPVRAELAVGAVVLVLVLATDLRGAIAFSSFGVLLYYFVANAAALTQPAPERRYPRALAVVGAVGCVVLVAALPPVAVLVGLAVLGLGFGGRALLRRA
ncbi:APC family permease [Herbiconiux moechotypicola]|nr:APC family permease [Herbiconiux moechotypicola]MCS5728975.1 APC family permease [Herbiconiux moechotypicola]